MISEPHCCRECGAVIVPLLTDKQEAIAALVGEGLSNAEIGGHLGLTMGTVKNQITTIFKKLNYSNRTQVAMYAIREGLCYGEAGSEGGDYRAEGRRAQIDGEGFKDSAPLPARPVHVQR